MKFKRIKLPNDDYYILNDITNQDIENYIENKEDEEEKEVAQPTSYSSEEVHGGKEMTNSILDSPNPSSNKNEEERKEGQEIELENNEKKEYGTYGKEGNGESGGRKETSEENGEKDEENGSEEKTEEEFGKESKENARSVITHKYVSISTLKFAFYKVLDTLADIRVSEIDGFETLSMKRIVRRTLDKKPIERCYVDYIHEDIYLLLDDSGSMSWWANLLNALATLAVKRKDVKIVWSPNGDLENFEKFENKIVIYVGDFDGGDTPYILQKRYNCHVIWFCPEERHQDTLEHSWCSHSLNEIISSGVQFFRTNTLYDLLQAFRKVRRNW